MRDRWGGRAQAAQHAAKTEVGHAPSSFRAGQGSANMPEGAVQSTGDTQSIHTRTRSGHAGRQREQAAGAGVTRWGCVCLHVLTPASG